MSPAPITAFSFRGADGVLVTGFKAVPEGRPRALVQIAHGMAEHFNRYRRLTNALTGAGFAVYANDHRGHGASAAAHGLGEFGPGGFARVVEDLGALSRLALAQTPNTPLFLIGHSMGSFAAQLYLLKRHRRLAGLVLSGTAAVDALLAATAEGGGETGFAALNAPFAPTRTDFDWLSRDEAEVDAYVADPLCGFDLTAASMASVMGQAARARHDPALAGVRGDLPVYIISGERDPVTGPGQAFVEALIGSWRDAGLKRIEHRVWPDARHELFNEINREAVTAELIAWLEAHLPRTR